MNVRDTSYYGDTLKRHIKYDYVKGQKSWGLNTKPCHKPNKFALEVKGLCRIRIMNVLDTSSHCYRPMCQIWYANVKANRSYRSDMKTRQKPINLTLRSMVNIKSGTWMYLSHLLMVINSFAKYGKPMSNQKSYGPDTILQRQTDRQTDRESDSYIPPELR